MRNEVVDVTSDMKMTGVMKNSMVFLKRINGFPGKYRGLAEPRDGGLGLVTLGNKTQSPSSAQGFE